MFSIPGDHVDEESPREKSIENTVESQRKITDLAHAYLQPIFEYLDFCDLMNVADTCKLFQDVARSVFTDKYGSQTFAINSDGITIHGKSSPCVPARVRPLESIGKFSKFFGHSIIKLAIFGTCDEYYLQWIESCVCRYYSANLVEIVFYNYEHRVMMDDLNVAFPAMHSVTIIQCHLSKNISQFNARFPHLRSLKLIDSIMCDPSCIEVNFPELETLVIWLHGTRKNGFTKSNIHEAIRLNPNIKDLWLQFYSFPPTAEELHADQDLCQMIASNLKQLERFVWVPNHEELPNGDRITFKSVRHFTSDSSFERLTFKQLEELELRRTSIPINELIEYICRNKKLTKLKITLDVINLHTASSDQVSKLAKNLPTLTELSLDWHIFGEACLKFLSACKSLYRLQLINIYGRMSYFTQQTIPKTIENLCSSKAIENNWEILRTANDLIFERKH